MRDHIPFIPGCTSLADLEKEAIKRTMKGLDGNRTKAAHSLGISLRTLDSRLKDYKEEQSAEDARRNDSEHTSAVFLDRQRRGVQADAKEVIRNAENKKVQDAAEKDAADRQAEFLKRCREGAPSMDQGTKDGGKSAKGAAKEQQVPVSEREEVQGLLPDEAARARA